MQISDENLHHVRELMDEVFGKENLVSQILYRRGGFQTGAHIANTFDYIIWFSKDIAELHKKVNRVYVQASVDSWYSSSDKWAEYPNGHREVHKKGREIPGNVKIHSDRSCFSASGGDSSSFTTSLKELLQPLPQVVAGQQMNAGCGG